MYKEMTEFERPYTLQDVRAWKIAAFTDGWGVQRSYQNEPVDSACTMWRHDPDFKALLLMREKSETRTRGYFNISIWGPDGLFVRPIFPYHMATLLDELHVCSSCGAKNITPYRYSFAGRCCADCLPKLQARYERDGWNR